MQYQDLGLAQYQDLGHREEKPPPLPLGAPSAVLLSAPEGAHWRSTRILATVKRDHHHCHSGHYMLLYCLLLKERTGAVPGSLAY